MFNSSKSSTLGSSSTPTSPIASNAPTPSPIAPITPMTSFKYPLSPLLAACLNHSGCRCKYSCDSCEKVFPTTQALGGHQNAHRKERNALLAREQQRAAEENDRERTRFPSPDPLRWAPPVGHYKVDNYHGLANNVPLNNNNSMSSGVVRAYEFFHFLGMAGDMNPNWAAVGFRPPSRRAGGASWSGNKRSFSDGDGEAEAHNKKKKAKFLYEDVVMKAVMPSVDLSLAAAYGGYVSVDMDESDDSDLEWDDGEFMYTFGGDGEASTSKTEELDLTLKL